MKNLLLLPEIEPLFLSRPARSLFTILAELSNVINFDHCDGNELTVLSWGAKSYLTEHFQYVT
jgi:hypothetical protein